MKTYETVKYSFIQWIGEISEHRELIKLNWCFNTFGSGATPKAGNQYYYLNGTHNWLFTGDLNDGEIHKTNVNARIKELKVAVKNKNILSLNSEEDQTATNKKIKEAEKKLDTKLYAKYQILTEDEVKQLVVNDKWMNVLESAIKDKIYYINQRLTNRIKELAERYEETLSEIDVRQSEVEAKVNAYLQ